MQYVGQTGRSLKTRFREHFRKMKKPKKFDTFLYRHFKNNGHSPGGVVIRPVEGVVYDSGSSTRLENIKRHGTELRWIRFLQSPFPLGFDGGVCCEGNISGVPGFGVFSVLECGRRKSGSRGGRGGGNIERKVCTEGRLNTSLGDLSLALTNRGRHGLFSFLSSLPVSVLRGLGLEANRLYRGANELYAAALLAGCCVQHFLGPCVGSGVGRGRHFVGVPFIDKGNEFIDLHSIFKDSSVISSVPGCFSGSEAPVVCCGCGGPIGSAVFGFGGIVGDLDVDSSAPASWDCGSSNYLCPSAGHVVAGNLNVVPDAGVRNVVSGGPGCGFPSNIDFSGCRREIAASLGGFGGRWCKLENVEPGALREWRINIFKIIDTRVSFCSRSTHLLPPGPGSSFRHLGRGVRGFRVDCVLVPADGAAGNVVVV